MQTVFKDEVKQILDRVKVLGGKKKIVSNDMAIVSKQTGETTDIQVAFEEKRSYIVDNEKFVKLFKNTIDLFELSKRVSKMSVQIILWVSNHLQKNTTKIEINVKSLAEELGVKSLAKVYESLKDLETNGILRKFGKNVYEVNPSIMFNGSRIEFISTIISEKEEQGWKITEYRGIKAVR